MSMWDPPSDRHHPGAGTLWRPCAGGSVEDGTGRNSICPEQLEGTSSRTRGRKKSGMDVCGCDSRQGKITVDCVMEVDFWREVRGGKGLMERTHAPVGGPGLWTAAVEGHRRLPLIIPSLSAGNPPCPESSP